MLVQAGPTGDRVTVAVSGEYCLDDDQTLRHALHDALGRSAAGVDLDLSDLTFADCSALNVLLAVRGQAAAADKTVTVTAVSPAAERLLTFTDTYTLFTAPADATDPSPTEPDGAMRAEVVQLRRALRTRPDIDLARGILMATFGLNAEQAWQALVLTSQHTNLKLHRLAEDVVTTVQGASLPEPVQRELTAAVSRVRGGTRSEDTRETVCQDRGR
ncbi:ANTAR domain-containing protein [Streptomyces arenae]|uniref:ANTAR domain-containing protein n=1 Tax=Streptomyces arenae TaxID=29301 RepID=UPI0026595A13|nr:ANTAR domain-containing protein [Streptomyces arenae]MCG7210404.1 ANTAR domain-containing protein [Streptomyces arenae]